MGEPWLDSLSEDWNSELHLSSPAPSIVNSRNGTSGSRTSQSRIPHLAHSMRKDSASSSFLKPRSSRGIAKAKGVPVLSERSASSLNLPGQQTTLSSASKRLPSYTLPRRASSNFSDSQQSSQSVQHHTINTSSRETPEWKRRIQNGEDPTSDGFDLFSPSKLEGMFSQPAQSTLDHQENQSSYVDTNTKPWTSLKVSNIPVSTDQYLSYRTSRSRAPPMESLPELSEDDNDGGMDNGFSAISSDLVHGGSIQGLVRRRVDDFEQPPEPGDAQQNTKRVVSDATRDPRWRTVSGQQEIKNEFISPVTASTRNTITEKAIRNSVDLDSNALKQKLMDIDSARRSRPSSRSSDRDISYDGQSTRRGEMLHDESIPDMTTHSLPEDLSMGTQDFVAHGGYVNSRRGPTSNETSFLKKKLSSVDESSQQEHRLENGFRSSPPPYDSSKVDFPGRGMFNRSVLASPQEDSMIHHDPSKQRPTSAGSPLKLFGNRDTYTNNKLLRVLSQYEDGSDQSKSMEKNVDVPSQILQPDGGFRMSQFGKGDLDDFNFVKEVDRPATAYPPLEVDGDKIFQSLADLTIEDEGTIQEMNLADKHIYQDLIAKRISSSPSKDRTPKRRRTLVRDEIHVEGIDIEVKVDRVLERSSLAGRKRKDAKPGEGGSQADPEVLASRAILRPKPGSRKSSGQNQNENSTTPQADRPQDGSQEVTEALAAELASFAQGVSEAHQDSRKPSLATKDYMEEANKVMEFIRARGKPKPKLSGIQEPLDSSELDADRILDLEVDDDSTQEPFSRPPSREGPSKPRENRRIAKHDPQVASHLQKFKDSDDLDLLASTSVMGTLHLVDNRAAAEAACVPVPEDEQESSPPNIRILNPGDSYRKRKHSASTYDRQGNMVQSPGSSTRRTFATESSNSSGQKGVISSGTVSIPDQVGTMTFDHEKQTWIKQHLVAQQGKQNRDQQLHADRQDDGTLDEDPFQSIPDLSIDEQHEAAMRVVPKDSRPSTASTVRKVQQSPASDHQENERVGDYCESEAEQSIHKKSGDESTGVENSQSTDNYSSSHMPSSLRSEASKHEERLHDGIPSRAPTVLNTVNKQPRVVTIVFSSPPAREIPQPKLADPAPVSSDDEEFLPPDDSDDDIEFLKTPQGTSSVKAANSSARVKSTANFRDSIQIQSNTLQRRPVSRIDEEEDEGQLNEGMSLVRFKQPQANTPDGRLQTAPLKPISAYKGTSVLCLTPLSEFTMHQADQVNHPEESFVQARAYPKALLQAHGSLALSVDVIVKAITDAVPDEPFWEQLHKLDLSDSRLPSAHGLEDYCSVLEVLNISKNQIAQLDGLPSSLRHLDASYNQLNDFTSWSKLRNLQYVDVSSNKLENLEAFSSLVHVRRLKACKNQISDIEGILDLDGLISLNIHGNQLSQLDFEGVDMPRLEDLDLSSNKLTSIHNLHFLPQLKRLDLSDNNLRELQMVEPLPHLKYLAISRNELESLDLTMFPALTELDLDGNRIKDIAGLSSAIDLRKICVREQRGWTEIVDLVLTTPNECSEIYLSSNLLTLGQMRLPKFPQYNLRRLELAACGLRALPLGFGDYFPNCRDLNLNFNAVSELDPLLGAVKLRKLVISGNRIRRLRRTCLVLSRMQTLENIDLRDNPLTVGFYAPERGNTGADGAYLLPKRSVSQDDRWLQLLDETTSLRRRMIELLLAQGCPRLEELDGSSLVKEIKNEHDTTWDNLTKKGVLLRTIEAPPHMAHTLVTRVPASGNATGVAHNDHETAATYGIGQERSIMVE